MTWTYTDEYYKEYTRTTWNESARVYVELMRRLEPYRSDLIARAAPRPGEHFLDLATGPGEPAMTIARLVGPQGRVLGADLSEEMVKLAREVAKARGLSNVEFEVIDAEKTGLPDASFDGVVSAFGFQIFTDPETAARETHRVLKPGGRLAAAVWSTGEKVPAIDVLIGPMLEHAEPDETGYLPTPYEMGGPGELVAFLTEAGFAGATERRTTHTWDFKDADEYLKVALEGTPIGHSLHEEDKDVQAEVLAKARTNLKAYTTPQGIRLPAECVVVTASR